jgi:hypothetical protein
LFNKPVALKSVTVTTGRPNGDDVIQTGMLQASTDSKHFTDLAKFSAGKAQARSMAGKLRALRIRPTAALSHPLVIREIAIASEPRVSEFKYLLNSSSIPARFRK